MEFLYEYGLFFAKAITIVIAVVAVLVVSIGLAAKQKPEGGNLSFDSINDQINELKRQTERLFLSKSELKKVDKDRKKEEKSKEKEEKPKLFIIDFVGSPLAKEVEDLRKEISAILCVAKDKDEVLVNVESGGGVVHGYGLAASQLQRIKNANLHLTVSIDKVAASGGYMMASVADKILCAPFAIVGSIGVIAQLPNFNKLLKKNDIDFEMHTAGEYKRTLTVLGENTDEARKKFKEDINQIHSLFKEHVKHYREQLELDKVATGEYWLGKQALGLGLVDELTTSDDFMMSAV
ncbi:MAG: protease SohB, partial [Pseudomonadota bacterium]